MTVAEGRGALRHSLTHSPVRPRLYPAGDSDSSLETANADDEAAVMQEEISGSFFQIAIAPARPLTEKVEEQLTVENEIEKRASLKFPQCDFSKLTEQAQTAHVGT